MGRRLSRAEIARRFPRVTKAFEVRDVLVEAGAELREIGRRPSPASRLIDEAVYQVGQAIYGRNAYSPNLVRQSVRSALALVLRARQIKGAPVRLGTVATLLRTALRNVPKRSS